MKVADYTNNQLSNQVSPGSKHYFIRIFLTSEQQARLTDAVALKKEYLAKLEKVTGKCFPATTAYTLLFEAFSHMSNECLDTLIADLITRIGEDMKECPQ